jgi:hypothetical protein
MCVCVCVCVCVHIRHTREQILSVPSVLVNVLCMELNVCVSVCVCVCVCACVFADFVGTKRVGECVLHRVPNVRPSPRPHHQHRKHVLYSGLFLFFFLNIVSTCSTVAFCLCSKVAFWVLCTHHAPRPHLEYFKSV